MAKNPPLSAKQTFLEMVYLFFFREVREAKWISGFEIFRPSEAMYIWAAAFISVKLKGRIFYRRPLPRLIDFSI